MPLTPTLIVLALCAALFGVANYISRRPAELGRPRLVPWHGVQFLALIGMVLMLAHLVTLLTGQPLVGRFSG